MDILGHKNMFHLGEAMSFDLRAAKGYTRLDDCTAAELYFILLVCVRFGWFERDLGSKCRMANDSAAKATSKKENWRLFDFVYLIRFCQDIYYLIFFTNVLGEIWLNIDYKEHETLFLSLIFKQLVYLTKCLSYF